MILKCRGLYPEGKTSREVRHDTAAKTHYRFSGDVYLNDGKVVIDRQGDVETKVNMEAMRSGKVALRGSSGGAECAGGIGDGVARQVDITKRRQLKRIDE